jgi:ABC-type transporter Mla subunit MlaD
LREIDPMPNWNYEIILTAFVALTAIAMLIQAILLLVVYLSTRRAIRTLHADFMEFRSTITPLVDNARGFLARVGPKVEATASDLADISSRLRNQAIEVETTTAEVLKSVRRNTARVSEIASGMLDTVDRAGEYVTQTINRPLRQFSGVIAAVKAIIATLRSPARGARETGDPDDTFV